MEPRLDFYETSPDAIKAMLAFSAATEKLGLEKPLLELVKPRASQINGGAFCVDMHAADARKGGATERRLYAVVAWRETPFFTPRSPGRNRSRRSRPAAPPTTSTRLSAPGSRPRSRWT